MGRDTLITFGKHKGKTHGFVADNHPRYYLWCCRNVSWFKPEDSCLKSAKIGTRRYIMGGPDDVEWDDYDEIYEGRSDWCGGFDHGGM